MEPRPIHNENDLRAAMDEMRRLWDAEDPLDIQRLADWGMLVDLYESSLIAPPRGIDPVAVIVAEMETNDRMRGDPLPPIHPGEVLLEDFLRPLGIGTTVAARRMGLPRTRIERVVRGEVGITADTALRLEAFLGAPARVWLNLQNLYDLEVSRGRLGQSIPEIRPWPREAG